MKLTRGNRTLNAHPVTVEYGHNNDNDLVIIRLKIFRSLKLLMGPICELNWVVGCLHFLPDFFSFQCALYKISSIDID